MGDKEGLSGLERSQPLILITAMLLGLAAGVAFGSFGAMSNDIIFLGLFILMYGIALGTPLQSVARSFTRLRFFGIAWSVNFVIIPLVGFILAYLFLNGSPLVFVGFIMYAVMPCTDWFLVFTSMSKGDVPLGMALLPTNLVLQVLMLPLYLMLFAAQMVPFQLQALIETVILFIIVPFALAILTNWVAVRSVGAERKEKLFEKMPLVLQTASLASVVFFMFAAQTPTILDNISPLSIILVPVIIFIILAFFISQGIGRWSRLSYGESALLTCTSIARNSPLALAISFGLFPDRPLIQVAIIIGVMIELPALVLIVKVLNSGRSTYDRGWGRGPQQHP